MTDKEAPPELKTEIEPAPDVIVTIRWSPSDPDPAGRVNIHVVSPSKPTALQVFMALSAAQSRVAGGMNDMVNGLASRIKELEVALKDVSNPGEAGSTLPPQV